MGQNALFSTTSLTEDIKAKSRTEQELSERMNNLTLLHSEGAALSDQPWDVRALGHTTAVAPEKALIGESEGSLGMQQEVSQLRHDLIDPVNEALGPSSPFAVPDSVLARSRNYDTWSPFGAAPLQPAPTVQSDTQLAAAPDPADSVVRAPVAMPAVTGAPPAATLKIPRVGPSADHGAQLALPSLRPPSSAPLIPGVGLPRVSAPPPPPPPQNAPLIPGAGLPRDTRGVVRGPWSDGPKLF